MSIFFIRKLPYIIGAGIAIFVIVLLILAGINASDQAANSYSNISSIDEAFQSKEKFKVGFLTAQEARGNIAITSIAGESTIDPNGIVHMENNPFFTEFCWPLGTDTGWWGTLQGSRNLSNSGTKSHAGWDIGQETHQAVYAIYDGWIVASENTSYGHKVHLVKEVEGGYLRTTYLHLCAGNCSGGQYRAVTNVGTYDDVGDTSAASYVHIGEIIGYTGASGVDISSDMSAHLHMEMYFISSSVVEPIDIAATRLWRARPQFDAIDAYNRCVAALDSDGFTRGDFKLASYAYVGNVFGITAEELEGYIYIPEGQTFDETYTAEFLAHPELNKYLAYQRYDGEEWGWGSQDEGHTRIQANIIISIDRVPELRELYLGICEEAGLPIAPVLE